MCSRERTAGSARGRPQDHGLTDFCLPRTNPQVAGCLYYLVQVFDGLCQRHEMLYWADGGTLLGVVRHSGLIPWDDDLDVQLAPGAEQMLTTEHVYKQLREMGVELRPVWFGYKLCPIVCPSYGQVYTAADDEELGGFIWPFLDIFLTTYDTQHPEKILYKSVLAQQWYPNFYFFQRELFPLVHSPFGPCLITTPSSATLIRSRSQPRIGVMKPSAKAYQAVLAMLDLPTAACVFVDDQPVNIDAAQALGIQGIMFRDNPSCIAELTRLWATP